MGSHSVTCHPTEVRILPLPPAEAGTRFSDPGGVQGWVDLCYVKADRPGIEPATCKSQEQRPTAEPPRNTSVANSVFVRSTTNLRFLPDIVISCTFVVIFVVDEISSSSSSLSPVTTITNQLSSTRRQFSLSSDDEATRIYRRRSIVEMIIDRRPSSL